MEYWTIEVVDGELSALRWRDAYGDALVEAAHTNLVVDWQWTRHPWGVALELGFASGPTQAAQRTLIERPAASRVDPNSVFQSCHRGAPGGPLAGRLDHSGAKRGPRAVPSMP